MKSIVIVLVTLGMACHSVKETPRESTSEESNEQTVQNRTAQQSGIPGRITFKARVMKTFEEKRDICGLQKSNVVQVEVLEILERGSGITTMPRAKEVISVSFLLPPGHLVTDTIVEAKAKESLCPTPSQTYFIINSFKILE